MGASLLALAKSIYQLITLINSLLHLFIFTFILVLFLNYSLLHLSFQNILGYELYSCAVFFRFNGQFCRLEKGLFKLKAYYWYCFDIFQHTKLYPFQSLSRGFILILFLNVHNSASNFSTSTLIPPATQANLPLPEYLGSLILIRIISKKRTPTF